MSEPTAISLRFDPDNQLKTDGDSLIMKEDVRSMDVDENKRDINGISALPIDTKKVTKEWKTGEFVSFVPQPPTSSPVIHVSRVNSDTELVGSEDTVLFRGSPHERRPTSRPMTPSNPDESSSPSVSSFSPMLTTTGPMPARRPRHKPGERRELLTRAVEDVLNLKISMRRAAQKYNLAKSSLCDFVRKNKICLPNLRFKSCPTSPGTAVTPVAGRISSTCLKRTITDNSDSISSLTNPAKLSCGRKSGGSQMDSSDIVHLSFSTSESLGSGLSQTTPLDAVNMSSVESWNVDDIQCDPNSQDHLTLQARTLGLSVTSGNLPNRINNAPSLPRSARIESPWHNSAGLPTQVPMRSWSGHSSQNLGAAIWNCSTAALDRKLPFNSLNQLRQTIESQNFTAEQTSRMQSQGIDLSSVGSNSVPVSVLTEVTPFRKPSETLDDFVSQSRDTPSSVNESFILGCSHSTPLGFSSLTESLDSSSNITSLNRPSSSANGLTEGLFSNPSDTQYSPTSRSTPANTTDGIAPNGDLGTSNNSSSDLSSLVFSLSSTFPGNFSPANSLNSSNSRNESNTFVRPQDTRFTLSAHDSHFGDFRHSSPLCSLTENSVPNPATSTSPDHIGSNPPSISATPCPSLASILSTDFSSLNQTAVAALLLQHSRNLTAAQTNFPNLLGCPNNIVFQTNSSAPPAVPSPFPTDFTSPTPFTGLSRIPSTTSRPNTARLSSGQPQLSSCPVTALSNLPTNFPSTETLNQLHLEEFQQLVNRHIQSRLSGTVTPSTPSALTAHLPHLSEHYSHQSLRNLVANLLGSVNSKSQNPESINLKTSAGVPDSDGSPHLGKSTISHKDPRIFLTDNPSPPATTEMNKIGPHARGLVDFINSSPSPFHAVQTACDILASRGFRELKEGESWRLKPNDCIYVKKNSSTVLIAAVGGRYQPGNGFHLIGAHTDSPSLRLKPVSDRPKEGYVQLGVETYGGGLWYTWFDRELKVAGRVVTASASGRLEERLIHIDRPIACVPSLAIHLNRDVVAHGFNPNTEQHVVPILCTTVMEQLSKSDEMACSSSDATFALADEPDSVIGQVGKRKHPASLLRLVAQQLGISEPQDPLELELYLADCQPARIGGLHNEFIHAPRLDNLFNSYAGLQGLLESMTTLPEEACLRVVCLYDHEEVGSTSTQGANSAHTINILRRIASTLASDKHAFLSYSEEPLSPVISSSHFEESLSKSFLLSADQAHAVHPSYHEKHEVNHKPQLHGGLVLKCNVNQRYATNSLTSAAVRQVARFAEVPVQEFVVRQDSHCGSTIGPLLSSQLGIPTADVGFPQLAMHSCRELCCTTSVGQAVRFYTSFFEHMPNIWPPS